jgi:hypothetical protein
MRESLSFCRNDAVGARGKYAEKVEINGAILLSHDELSVKVRQFKMDLRSRATDQTIFTLRRELERNVRIVSHRGRCYEFRPTSPAKLQPRRPAEFAASE